MRKIKRERERERNRGGRERQKEKDRERTRDIRMLPVFVAYFFAAPYIYLRNDSADAELQVNHYRSTRRHAMRDHG